MSNYTVYPHVSRFRKKLITMANVSFLSSLIGMGRVGGLDVGLDGGGGFDAVHLLLGGDGALPGGNDRRNCCCLETFKQM